MRRVIVFTLWILILAWILAWLGWTTQRGEPSNGPLWAIFSLSTWWVIGATDRKGKRKN